MSDDRDEQAELAARLDRLKGELNAAKPKPTHEVPPKPTASDSTAAAMSMGLRAGSEFVAAVLVGGAIGWGLDWLLHTKPAFIIVFFLIGVAAGVWNVIRVTSPKGGN